MSVIKKIDRIITPQGTSDGAGVKIKRAIGTHGFDQMDPFLMLDLFGSNKGADYIAGFPDHPHRGFETVTYMLHGKMRHKDNQGNEGLLESGGVQWMTAGRGLVHSEMPEQTDGLMKGFQLWVNLPKSHKMVAPRYQDIQPEDIPTMDVDGVGQLKLIAGELLGQKGAVTEIITDPLFVDVHMNENARFDIPVPLGHAAFMFLYEGIVETDGTKISDERLVTFEDGDHLTFRTGEQKAKFIVVAAKPIKEPVARYGPFVMNTQAEINQAFEDYRDGKFV